MEATVPAQEGLVARRTTLSRYGTRAWRAVRTLIEPRSIFLLALVAVSYGVTARLSLLFVLEPQNVAGIWPPAGIALGAFLVNQPRRWPLVVAGVVIAVSAANLAGDVPRGMTLGFVLANTVEPLLAAVLLRRAAFTSLGTLRGIGVFAAAAAIAAPMVGAAIGATSASAASGAPFLPTWITWALADAGGVLAIAPVVLVVRLRGPLPPVRWRLVAEVSGLAAGLIAIAALSFLPMGLPIQMAAYPTFLLLVLAAVRFGLVGAALATFGLAVIAMAGTIGGFGPIAHLNPNPTIQIGQAQIFVGVAFLTAFVTAAAMAERRVAAAALTDQMRLEVERASINERLTTFAHDISQSLEEEPLFQHIVHAAAQVVPADIVQLTVAADGGTHRVVAAIGAPSVIGRPVPLGDGVTGRVIRDGRPLTVAQQSPGERPEGWEAVIPESPVAVTSAPIIRDGAVVATLSLARANAGDPFRPDEVRALAMMCGLSGLALTNAVEFGRVHERSVSDELTGVPNRRYFNMAFEQLSAQRLRQAPSTRLDVSAIIFDLDHFGALNKERGHATGDVVLAAFGGILGNRLRRADVVARYGGEEFVALLVGTDRAGAMRVAEDVRTAFAAIAMKGADGDPIRCTVSAGVATITPDEPSLDGLLGTADVALSMAKRAGRNQVASA
ncbi:MAG TPA: diguanylate cyclase [Patescibacteria group bacterium]|nr:diguanylate cyclase [Patescibacteria group bacterium]